MLCYIVEMGVVLEPEKGERINVVKAFNLKKSTLSQHRISIIE